MIPKGEPGILWKHKGVPETCVYVHTYRFMCVCIWPPVLNAGHLEFVRVCCMLDIKLLDIYLLFVSFFHWCSRKHPALGFYSSRSSFDLHRLSVRGRSWLGESGQTGLPSHEPFCLPPVLITSLCKGSSGRKLAITCNSSRQDTSSLMSCQLTLAPILLSHPLFNQGRRSIRARHSTQQVGNDLLPCYQRAL